MPSNSPCPLLFFFKAGILCGPVPRERQHSHGTSKSRWPSQLALKFCSDAQGSGGLTAQQKETLHYKGPCCQALLIDNSCSPVLFWKPFKCLRLELLV